MALQHWSTQADKAGRVKVRYTVTDMVLVAVRDRQTGVWWQHDQLERLGE